MDDQVVKIEEQNDNVNAAQEEPVPSEPIEYKSLLFIINPVAGRKQAMPYITDIIQIFYDHGYITTTMLTTARGDAITFAENYAKDYDLIVCLGGDGTFSEVVTGLAHIDLKKPVGYIPAGSTNDFANTHNLATNVLEAAKNIVSKDVVPCDLGKIESHYFSYVAAFGAFCSLSYGTSQKLKNALGHTAYMIRVIPELMKLKSQFMRITDAEGNVYEDRFLYGSACNSTSVAGIFELPKDVVDTSDGKMEVILIHRPSNAKQFMDVVYAMFSQKYEKAECVDFFQTDHLHVETGDEETDWTLDGEFFRAPVSFDINNIHQFVELKG